MDRNPLIDKHQRVLETRPFKRHRIKDQANLAVGVTLYRLLTRFKTSRGN